MNPASWIKDLKPFLFLSSKKTNKQSLDLIAHQRHIPILPFFCLHLVEIMYMRIREDIFFFIFGTIAEYKKNDNLFEG